MAGSITDFTSTNTPCGFNRAKTLHGSATKRGNKKGGGSLRRPYQ
jgi:hypothetical protein